MGRSENAWEVGTFFLPTPLPFHLSAQRHKIYANYSKANFRSLLGSNTEIKVGNIHITLTVICLLGTRYSIGGKPVLPHIRSKERMASRLESVHWVTCSLLLIQRKINNCSSKGYIIPEITWTPGPGCSKPD